MREFTYDGVPNQPCMHLLQAQPAQFVAWATDEPQTCTCGLPVDWWESVRYCYVDAGAVFSAHAPMGGSTLHTMITLRAGEISQIDLTAVGLPTTATVSDINLTPSGGSSTGGILWPALIGGNRVNQSPLPHALTLYPAPMGELPPEAQDVSVHVQFTDALATTSRSRLVEATAAHVREDYRKSVIEGHTAADLALETACEAQLPGLSDNDLQSMSFAAKITCLSTARGVAVREDLLERARKLNTQRNKVAHPRRKQSELTQGDAADHLTTAVFMVHLAEWLGGQV